MSRQASRLLLVLLLVQAGWFAVAIAQESEFMPTGDALFDRYAAEVYTRQGWNPMITGRFPAALPQDVLAEWEDEFGDDPRYWELRYFCARSETLCTEDQYLWMFTEDSAEPAGGFLRRARELGAADWNTNCLLYSSDMLGTVRDSEAAINVLIEDHGWPPPRDELVEALQQMEARQAGIVNALVSADTTQAWPHFLAAHYYMSLGEYVAALTEFRLGNAAPECTIPQPFPVRFVIDRLAQGEYSGGESLTGAIVTANALNDMSNWIRWKENGKELLVAASLGGNQELLSAWHQCACRMGSAERATFVQVKVAAVLIGLQADGLLAECSSTLTSEQRSVLLEVNRYSNLVMSNVDQGVAFTSSQLSRQNMVGLMVVTLTGVHADWGSSLAPWLSSLHSNAHFGDMPKYEEQFAETAWFALSEQRWIREYCTPFFEALCAVDYATLEKPKGWYY